MTRRHRQLLVAALAAAALTAGCTGARLPEAQQDNQTLLPGGDQPTAVATGSPVPGVSATAGAGGGATGAGGSSGAGGYGGGGSSGGATGAGGSGGSGGGGTGTTASGPQLWSGPADKTGITNTQITLCAHAALTYASAFDTSPDDLNVYWSATNDAGGINGRKVVQTYEDDAYKPDEAVNAAKRCAAKNPFLLLGGIGFDQIPSVRNWAEQNRMLYMHHTVSVQGSQGLKYSYTALPSVEKIGEMFAQLAAKRFKGKKIGVLHRNSPYWDPGFNAFMQGAKRYGVTVVREIGTQKDQGNYLQELRALQTAGAEVVFAWENALAITHMVTQANGQQWFPDWMVFPFNLTTQTIGTRAIGKMVGLAVWPAYSCGDTSGPFAPYASTIREFEAQMQKYRPSAKRCSLGGDLMFLNWIEQKALAKMFLKCGRDCTRNKLAGMMLSGYAANDIPGHCPVRFADGHHGSDYVNVFEPYRAPDGNVNWRPTQMCVRSL